MQKQSGERCCVLMSVLLLILPVVGQADVLNDAYSYIDEFADTTGLNLAETSGVTVDGGALTTDMTSASVVSRCFSLLQPAGGAFVGWSFLDVITANLSGANTLEIQDCAGNVLLTANLTNGVNSLDVSAISAPSIRLRWTVNQVGAQILSWQMFGRAIGVTTLSVTPNAATVDAGDTITFTVKLASSGAITRNPVLHFSLDTINGLHTPNIDDGLAEDAEVDYGNGVKVYKPLELVSASNGPNGEVPTMPAIGATSGEILWNLNNLSDGFDNKVTVTLRVPKGSVNAKALAAKAVLEHSSSALSGAYTNRMNTENTSGLVTVRSVGASNQTVYSPHGNVGPGVTGIYEAYWLWENLEHPSDVEDVTATITNVGTCTPLFKTITVRSLYTYQVVHTPGVGEPITATEPVI